jgi:hypothetical protein
MPNKSQALIDLVRLIETGIVEQPLPADCGARLFEVNARMTMHNSFESSLTAPFSRPAYSRAAFGSLVPL